MDHLLLSEGQRGTNVLATELDAQGALELSKNLLVGDSTSSLVVVDLFVQQNIKEKEITVLDILSLKILGHCLDIPNGQQLSKIENNKQQVQK